MIYLSLNRSRQANLIDYEKKNVMGQNLLDFLQHGVKYCFPAQLGSPVRGTPTAHSHEYLKKRFKSGFELCMA